jgi:hypothetical protein
MSNALKKSTTAWLAWTAVWGLVFGSSRTHGQVPAPGGEKRPAESNVKWFRGALAWDTAPVDLSFLNASDRPAGRHGFVKVDGDRLVFQDGTPARFWGGSLTGPALFSTPRENIPRQARRIAQLGYNLMRIGQPDSDWVNPNIFGTNYSDTRHLDPKSIDTLDLWIKCLEDEGVYVWLDMHWRRLIKPADGVRGFKEIAAKQGIFWGYNYVSPDLMKLMKEFQHQYLNHINRYTRISYKKDPGVVSILLTNENDLTVHFGVAFLPGQHNPIHKGWFDREMTAFAQETGLSGDRLARVWEPGPAMYFLSDLEHRFNRVMIDDLRADGVRAPIVTSNFWSPNALRMLTSLTDGDMIDVHSYGENGAFGVNPRQQPNYVSVTAAGQVYGKPLSVSEWSVPFPRADRFTGPLYVASVASLQGWDLPIVSGYSQAPLQPPGPGVWTDEWSAFCDPAINGIMPAAAVAFRRGHISPARRA